MMVPATPPTAANRPAIKISRYIRSPFQDSASACFDSRRAIRPATRRSQTRPNGDSHGFGQIMRHCSPLATGEMVSAQPAVAGEGAAVATMYPDVTPAPAIHIQAEAPGSNRQQDDQSQAQPQDPHHQWWLPDPSHANPRVCSELGHFSWSCDGWGPGRPACASPDSAPQPGTRSPWPQPAFIHHRRRSTPRHRTDIG